MAGLLVTNSFSLSFIFIIDIGGAFRMRNADARKS